MRTSPYVFLSFLSSLRLHADKSLLFSILLVLIATSCGQALTFFYPSCPHSHFMRTSPYVFLSFLSSRRFHVDKSLRFSILLVLMASSCGQVLTFFYHSCPHGAFLWTSPYVFLSFLSSWRLHADKSLRFSIILVLMELSCGQVLTFFYPSCPHDHLMRSEPF